VLEVLVVDGRGLVLGSTHELGIGRLGKVAAASSGEGLILMAAGVSSEIRDSSDLDGAL